MRIVAGDRSRESKGQQKAEERKDSAFNRVALHGMFSAETKTAAKLQQKKHGWEEQKRENWWKDHWPGDDDSKLACGAGRAKRRTCIGAPILFVRKVKTGTRDGFGLQTGLSLL